MSTLRAPETDLTRFYAIFPQPALARDLFNIVEGHRVDSAIRRAYPGIRRDMAKIQAASAERRPFSITRSFGCGVSACHCSGTAQTLPPSSTDATRSTVTRGTPPDLWKAPGRLRRSPAVTVR